MRFDLKKKKKKKKKKIHSDMEKVLRTNNFPLCAKKKKTQTLKVSDFVLLLVVFKWHDGSEWVNV